MGRNKLFKERERKKFRLAITNTTKTLRFPFPSGSSHGEGPLLHICTSAWRVGYICKLEKVSAMKDGNATASAFGTRDSRLRKLLASNVFNTVIPNVGQFDFLR